MSVDLRGGRTMMSCDGVDTVLGLLAAGEFLNNVKGM